VYESICVVGNGRLGRAASARLEERGVAVRAAGRELDVGSPDLVLLCVPDRAIADVARAIEPGPWVAHTSGATSIAALAPHSRRFGLHPLQTFQADLGPEQFDGAYAAVTGESPDALAAGYALAALLDVRAFELEDENRPTYHAAATMAAAFLVTLRRAAGDLMDAAEAPPEALEPLMRRTMDNGFRPTGPFVRGDHATIELHLRAIAERRPHLDRLYRALATATETLAVR
jgi:predicted short-subunit dehydrogenase-like oxidoreductase (DUF2520 family)